MASRFLNLSVDTTLGGNAPSDEIVPSQKAIKDYVDNNSGGGGSSYTAGTGIDITSNVISVDLTAGDGIGVSGATISLGNIDCGTME